jgi:hypothetical protein
MHKIPDILRADMERKNIDIPLSLKVLEELNRSLSAGDKSPGIRALPPLDDPRIVRLENSNRDEGKPLVFVEPVAAEARLARYGLELPKGSFGGNRVAVRKNSPPFLRSQLSAIGKALLPYTAYGVLTGGSATSYADEKKNLSLGSEVFQTCGISSSAWLPCAGAAPRAARRLLSIPMGAPAPLFSS